MTFEEAQTYLHGTINEAVSRRNPARLDRMRAFLHELGDPHRAYPTIHVGGTSGKGSTATMIAAALTASGKRTGLHTKPHLSSMTERARIDGVPIVPEAFGALLEEMLPAARAVEPDLGRPSYYEMLLALAFLYFARQRVATAVIEVGIGGLLDGTNVLEPVVSVITNIGLDHTDILGDTLEAIARDKAGIAKRGVPLVSDVVAGRAREVIEERCAAAGAPFISVQDRTRVTVHPGARYGQSFEVQTPQARYQLEVPLLGTFQRRNAATAISALEEAPPPLRPPLEAVQRAFARLEIPGRMEFFPGYPSVVFDIAHNPDKARGFAQSLAEQFPDRRFTFVIAIGESKDAAGVLQPFLELPGSFVFTSFEAVGRTPVRPQRLASIAQEHGRWVRALGDPVEAFAVARRSADADNIIVVTGSTFVVATLRDWFLANAGAATTR